MRVLPLFVRTSIVAAGLGLALTRCASSDPNGDAARAGDAAATDVGAAAGADAAADAQAGADAADVPTGTGPVISAVAATDVTRTGARITWTLNEPATGQVEYGATTAYGQMSTRESSFDYSAHGQALSGLSPGTLYHFRVHSVNRAGAESISDDYTFTTQPAAAGCAPRSGSLYPPDTPYSSLIGRPSDLARPGHRIATIDPDFETEIVRISDGGEVHDYPKTQPWNCDQSLIRLNRWILDARTYEVRLTIPSLPNEVKWSSTDPNRLFGERGNEFVSIDATTGAVTTLHTFSGYDHIHLGPWEGNISIDDSTVVLVTEGDNRRLPLADIIVYDIAHDRIVATRSLASMGYGAGADGNGIDWASISQSGDYVVINGGPSSDPTVKSYRRDLTFVATLFPAGQHGDIGYDAFGNEVYVQVGTAGGPALMSRLDNGVQTIILHGAQQAGHMSCRNIHRPGWCYLTQRFSNALLGIRLDGSEVIEAFTFARTSDSDYQHMAFGVSSPDGTMMMYRSDWNGTALNSAFVTGMPDR